MYVLPTNKNAGYKDDFRNFLKLKRFENDCGDFVLSEGFFEKALQWEQFDISEEKLHTLLQKRMIRFDFDEPTKTFIGENPDEYDKYFETIFTICPYTAKWLNTRQGNKKRRLIFYPTNENLIPPKTKKIYDIIYVGNLVSKRLMHDINVIKNYNYRFVSFSKHSLVTNRNVSYKSKLKLISQSKIALVHNVLFPNAYHMFNTWRQKDWGKNEAFKLLPRWYNFWKIFTDKSIVVPQQKSRLFESAFGKALILCKKDPFNIIENFFTPGKDFIYYNDNNLEKTIDKVLNNFNKYQKIVNHAYKKAKENYTTKALVRDYLSKI